MVEGWVRSESHGGQGNKSRRCKLENSNKIMHWKVIVTSIHNHAGPGIIWTILESISYVKYGEDTCCNLITRLINVYKLTV